MTAAARSNGDLAAKAAAVERELLEHVLDGGRLGIVKAPPGSGKTTLLRTGVVAALKRKNLRVAVAAQTNTQANDICLHLGREHPDLAVVRFASENTLEPNLGPSILWETKTGHLPHGPTVVVATAAKWGLVDLVETFDVLFVDEAWQLSWSDFMLLGQVAPRFVLIGDPGQIPPVVSIDVNRWETSPRPPHRPAPETILADPKVSLERWDLPATRRLPQDTAELVAQFYDFGFGAFAQPGERQVLVDGNGRRPEERLLHLLRDGSAAALTLPTPDEGPPLEEDDEVAEVASRIVQALIANRAQVRDADGIRLLQPEEVGLCATHRAMNTALDLALPRALRGKVRVDTAERWQGLECKVMIIVHPLSGVVRPSTFDLQTGRLCVMASRHRAGMIVLARDHVRSTLEDYIPSASQALGRPDIEGRGLRDNLEFWKRLAEAQRVVAA